MELPLFAQALLIGLSIAAPVGPIGLLCIQRTLAHGARIGVLSGVGAALADACYGALGALGVSALIAWLVAVRVPPALGGAAFLGWMALQMWRQPATPTNAAAQAPAAPRAGPAFLSVFVLTLANPMTILSFVAIFATLAGGQPMGAGRALLFTAGVFVGSALWWLGLRTVVGRLRQRLGTVAMRRINRASALVLLAFAAWQLWRLWAER